MFSHYDLTVPVFIKSLGGMRTVLEKAIEFGLTDDFLAASLADDMFPFVKQVQIACDNAKGAAGRLAQVEVPSFPDTEATLGELVVRIDATIAFLESLSPEQFSDAADVVVTLPYFPGTYMTGSEYLLQFALPNFFFHVSQTYALVRRAGVSIGKNDYLNGIPLRPLE